MARYRDTNHTTHSDSDVPKNHTLPLVVTRGKKTNLKFMYHLFYNRETLFYIRTSLIFYTHSVDRLRSLLLDAKHVQAQLRSKLASQ